VDCDSDVHRPHNLSPSGAFTGKLTLEMWVYVGGGGSIPPLDVNIMVEKVGRRVARSRSDCSSCVKRACGWCVPVASAFTCPVILPQGIPPHEPAECRQPFFSSFCQSAPFTLSTLFNLCTLSTLNPKHPVQPVHPKP
jgi:hypothetical protein